MQIWHFIQTQFSSNNFLNAAVIGGILAGIAISLKRVPKIVYRYFLGKIMTSITIDSKNELFYWLNGVIENLPFHKHRYAFYVFGKKRNYDKSEDENTDENIEDDSYEDTSYTQEESYKTANFVYEEKQSKRFLEYIYSPDEGHYIFRYKGRWLFIFLEKETKNSGNPLFTLRISYFGRSKKFFDDLMDEAEARYKKFYKEKIVLVTNDAYGSWIRTGSKVLLSKPIESVILPEGRMEDLLSGIDLFKKSEQKYIELGIPYHRTYLFYGVPGTGKTSTIYALANYFNMALFYLNLQIASDDYVSSLFAEVNQNSILVIEDIGNIYNGEDLVQERSSGKSAPPSYNVFINCLDGFLSKHGALTILTTNHYDRLSISMKRPGRIDKQIQFSACDSYQIYTMCYRYYKYLKMPQEKADQRATLMKGLFSKQTITPALLQKILLESNIDFEDNAYIENIHTICSGDRNGK